MSNNVDFKLVVPLVKAERSDGWYILGVAAGTGVDKDGDELTPVAIQRLAEQINSERIPLRNHHKKDSITEDLGYLVKATVTPDFQLTVEAKLDEDHPEAQYLWKKLDQGKQYGMSIHGQSVGWYREAKGNKPVRKHNLVLLDELSVTTRPVFTPSLGSVLRKAIDEAGSSLANEGETMATSTQTGEVTTNGTAQSSAPETDTSTVEKATTLTPSQQLVKDLMADDGFVTLIKASVAEATKSQEQPAKSDDSTDSSKSEDIVEIVKSTITAVSQSFESKLEALASRIPEQSGPGVLQKSEEETVQDILTSLKDDPRARLRLGLAARSGELDKVR